MEGAATTVYAQGGRGNARLIAWEGERTVTFTMEDALISAEGFSILTGAGLTQAEEKPIIVHRTEITNDVKLETYQGVPIVEILIDKEPYMGENRIIGQYNGSGNSQTLVDLKEDFVYVMLLDDKGDIISEPYVASEIEKKIVQDSATGKWKITIPQTEGRHTYASDFIDNGNNNYTPYRINDLGGFFTGCSVLVDYYTKEVEKAYQIDITPDDFSGNFYLEASTLFRAQNGVDMPAEFVIPNCKIQSNFTFTMASSGDPSTFTFTLDAFPDYTRWNKKKKVYAAIQIIEQGEITEKFKRLGTKHNYINREDCEPFRTYNKQQAIYLEDEVQTIDNLIFNSIDINGNIYNNELGYKKNYKLSGQGEETVDNANECTITGFIPYQYNQSISIIGGAEGGSISQRVCFYNENFEFIKYISINEANAQIVDSGQLPEQAKYIRVCLKNKNIRDMVIWIEGEPYTEENDNG